MRQGRWSESGAEYFLTCCTDQRMAGLEEAAMADAILAVANQLVREGAWALRTAVVMRDHVHLLVILGAKTDLAAAVRLFKGRTAPLLRRTGLKWQRSYFDHRMRPNEDRLPIFRYVFLNPHRAGLLKLEEKWPAYFCESEDWVWFRELMDQECPLPEWLW